GPGTSGKYGAAVVSSGPVRPLASGPCRDAGGWSQCGGSGVPVRAASTTASMARAARLAPCSSSSRAPRLGSAGGWALVGGQGGHPVVCGSPVRIGSVSGSGDHHQRRAVEGGQRLSLGEQGGQAGGLGGCVACAARAAGE